MQHYIVLDSRSHADRQRQELAVLEKQARAEAKVGEGRMASKAGRCVICKRGGARLMVERTTPPYFARLMFTFGSQRGLAHRSCAASSRNRSGSLTPGDRLVP